MLTWWSCSRTSSSHGSRGRARPILRPSTGVTWLLLRPGRQQTPATNAQELGFGQVTPKSLRGAFATYSDTHAAASIAREWAHLEPVLRLPGRRRGGGGGG